MGKRFGPQGVKHSLMVVKLHAEALYYQTFVTQALAPWLTVPLKIAYLTWNLNLCTMKESGVISRWSVTSQSHTTQCKTSVSLGTPSEVLSFSH